MAKEKEKFGPFGGDELAPNGLSIEARSALNDIFKDGFKDTDKAFLSRLIPVLTGTEGMVKFTGLECYVEKVRKKGVVKTLVFKKQELAEHFNGLWSDEYYYDLADFMKNIDPEMHYHYFTHESKRVIEKILVITKQPDLIEYTEGLDQDTKIICGSGFELANGIVTANGDTIIKNDVWLPVFWKDYMTYRD